MADLLVAKFDPIGDEILRLAVLTNLTAETNGRRRTSLLDIYRRADDHGFLEQARFTFRSARFYFGGDNSGCTIEGFMHCFGRQQ